MAHRPNIRNASIECTKAIINLTTLSGNLHNRLVAALANGFAHVNEKDLLDDLRSDYDALHERVTAKGIVNLGEGRIHATLREMDEEELREVAMQLLEFAQAVWRESSRQKYQSQ
jgi:uncharacterized protein (DUF2461 family)